MIYVGVDGGGTKTKIMIYKDDLFIGETTVKNSSSTLEKQEFSVARITEGIDYLFQKFEVTEKVDSIFLGIGGVPSKTNIESFKKKLKSPHFHKEIIVSIDNDIKNAFESACLGRPGIAVIVGTGSVAYGVDEEGNSVRVGGVHFHEGDLGSGYNIGLTSLRYMSKSFDGRVKKTPFVGHLLDKFNIQSMGDIADLFVRITNERMEVASIAKTAYEYLEKNDMIATEIFDISAQNIVDHIIAVDKQIHLSNKEIGIIGSLGSAELYFALIKKKVLEYDSKFDVHLALVDPCVGSVRIAKKMTEI